MQRRLIEKFFTKLIQTIIFSLLYIIYLNKTSIILFKTLMFLIGVEELNDLDNLKSIYNDLNHELDNNKKLLSSLEEKHKLLLIENDNLMEIMYNKNNLGIVNNSFPLGFLFIITGVSGFILSTFFILYPELITSNFNNIVDLISNNSLIFSRNNNEKFDILDGKIVDVSFTQQSILRLIHLIQASIEEIDNERN